MLKKIGFSLSALLLLGILVSCEQQESYESSTEEIEIGNLENDVIIKIDSVTEQVLLSGDEVSALEVRFEESEGSEEVFFSRENESEQRCLKLTDQLLMIERAEDIKAKLKQISESANADELWDLCALEFESFAQD